MSSLRHLLALAPAIGLMAAPLTVSAKTFKEIVETSIVPLGDLFVALLYAVAFAAFLIGLVRFFLASGNEEARTNGKQLMFWGLVALVVLFGVWGIVKVLLGVLQDWA